MGSACSRIRRKASHVDERELYDNKGPHPPWPSPSNRPEPRTIDLSRRPSEALEKGRHEAVVVPPSARAHKITPCSSESKDVQPAVVIVDVGSGESEAAASTEENKDEKRRLSRILSGRASSVRSMTSTVAKKGASRVRAFTASLCSILLLDPVNWLIHKMSSEAATRSERAWIWGVGHTGDFLLPDFILVFNQCMQCSSLILVI